MRTVSGRRLVVEPMIWMHRPLMHQFPRRTRCSAEARGIYSQPSTNWLLQAGNMVGVKRGSCVRVMVSALPVKPELLYGLEKTQTHAL